MPGFSSWVTKAHQNVTRFFNTTLPTNVSKGIRFFNTTVLPAAEKTHKVTSVISKELHHPNVHPKVREAAQKTSAFSELGLGRLKEAQTGINRAAAQLGLD